MGGKKKRTFITASSLAQNAFNQKKRGSKRPLRRTIDKIKGGEKPCNPKKKNIHTLPPDEFQRGGGKTSFVKDKKGGNRGEKLPKKCMDGNKGKGFSLRTPDLKQI